MPTKHLRPHRILSAGFPCFPLTKCQVARVLILLISGFIGGKYPRLCSNRSSDDQLWGGTLHPQERAAAGGRRWFVPGWEGRESAHPETKLQHSESSRSSDTHTRGLIFKATFVWTQLAKTRLPHPAPPPATWGSRPQIDMGRQGEGAPSWHFRQV